MTRAEKIDLIRSRPQLSVATLSADMGNQNAALQTLQENDVNLLHFDVMDNHYVPNLTVGPLVCEALRKHGVEAPIDAHLMVRLEVELPVLFFRDH